MTRLFLQEDYYCTLHLVKDGTPVSGQSPILNIMRNSDGRFLKPSTGNWNLTLDDIAMNNITSGIYQYKLDNTHFTNPESYTLIYKYNYNGKILQEIEQILFERKNRARLV